MTLPPCRRLSQPAPLRRNASKGAEGRRSVRKLTITLVVGLGMACVGCGTGPSERDVTSVVQRFQAAVVARDGAAACAQLTPSTRAAVASDEKEPCPRAVLSLGLRGRGRVSGADVYLTNGIAHVGDEAAFLDQTAHGWRISAAGCSPTRADLPYDCELEH